MTRRHRSIPLAVATLIALLGASVALSMSGGSGTVAHDHATEPARATITRGEFVFRSEMRRLWEDHVTWTRLAVVSLTTGTPDAQATVGRLLRNQTDIGNAMKAFYGPAAGTTLTKLLREHITIAADVISAAKAGDKSGLIASQARWQDNADGIAGFLSQANPRSWKLAPTRAMLRDHLRLTTQEVVARLQGDWDADVAAYDKIHRQALHMADMLSSGIVAQFPGRFR